MKQLTLFLFRTRFSARGHPLDPVEVGPEQAGPHKVGNYRHPQ